MKTNAVYFAATGRSKSQRLRQVAFDVNRKSLSVSHRSLDAIHRGMKTHR